MMDKKSLEAGWQTGSATPVGPRQCPSRPAPNDFTRYEQLKADWIGRHPAATSEQYERAMRAIAEFCGV